MRNKNALIISFILFFAIIIFLQTGCSFNASMDESLTIQKNKASSPLSEPETTTVQIAAVGDILMHMPIVNSAYNYTKNCYEFSRIFSEVTPYFSSADLTIANLETTLSGDDKGFSGYPAFNSPSSLAKDLHAIGIDVVTTANNHCLDYGEKGLLNTIDTLDNAKLKHLGTYKNSIDQETPFILDIKGIKIGLMNYTETTNGIPVPQNKDYLVNIINEEQMMKEVKRFKEEQVDTIIACIHFGTEYQREPNMYQKKLADKLFAMGVDIILGNHAHVIQPMERLTYDAAENKEVSGNTRDVFVIYSLGNFLSNQRWRYSDSGLILNILLEKNNFTNETILKEINYVPTWVHTYTKDKRLKYRVLPVYEGIYNYERNLDPLITSSDYKRLCEVWSETIEHINTPEKNILPVTTLHLN